MALVSKPYVTMSKGLVTEASPITSVEGSFFKGKNFTVDTKHNIRKRPGVRPDAVINMYDLTLDTYGQNIYKVHTFNLLSPITGNNLLVVSTTYTDKKEMTLVVKEDVDNDGTFSALRTGNIIKKFVMSLNAVVSFAQHEGKLVVYGRGIFPFYMDLTDYTLSPIPLIERDLSGLDDGWLAADRPTALDLLHKYNLYNQGWDDSKIGAMFTGRSTYPANNEKVEFGKYVDSSGIETWSTAGYDTTFMGSTEAAKGHITKNILEERTVSTGNEFSYVSDDINVSNVWTITTRTPHRLASGDIFIINKRGISEYCKVESGTGYSVTTPTSDTIVISGYSNTNVTHGVSYTGGDVLYIQKIESKISSLFTTSTLPTGTIVRITSLNTTLWVSDNDYNIADVTPTSAASWSSRLWFGGFSYKKAGRVYFSQLSNDTLKPGFFTSKNDPTSEIPDLLATDGGYIEISNVGTIVKLHPVKDGILVVAKNGIWKISGTINGQFSASDYYVNKVSNYGCSSPKGVAELNGVIYFANKSGVYVYDGNDTVQNISNERIKAELEAVHNDGWGDFIMFSDLVNNTVAVLINTEDGFGYDTQYTYNLTLGGWYLYKFAANNSYYKAVISNVISGQDPVSGLSFVKYITESVENIFFGSYGTGSFWLFVSLASASDTLTFKDFEMSSTMSGLPSYEYWIKQTYDRYVKADMYTAYEVMGELSERKSTSYIKMYKKNSSENIFTVKAVWDWMYLDLTKRQSELKQLSKFTEKYTETDTNVCVVKELLTGQGDCLYMYIEADDGKECEIYGWSIKWGSSG